MTDKEICICALSGLMDIIARKWSLFVLNIIGNSGRLRFNEIISGLGGVSPTTLTETLDKLVSLELLARTRYQETLRGWNTVSRKRDVNCEPPFSHS
jgi:DNA-binding HxlR family transcriptional regulator